MFIMPWILLIDIIEFKIFFIMIIQTYILDNFCFSSWFLVYFWFLKIFQFLTYSLDKEHFIFEILISKCHVQYVSLAHAIETYELVSFLLKTNLTFIFMICYRIIFIILRV